MKILLVRPNSYSAIANINIIDLEPLDLEYLHTVAKQEGFDTTIFDGIHDKRSLESVLKGYEPDIVCIGGYITQEALMLQYAEIVKRYHSAIKVIVGGVHAEVNYDRFFSKNVDYVIRSSSLEPFRKLIGFIQDGSDTNNKDMSGICYRNGDVWKVESPVFISPNELPIPDRTHFNENKHLYRYLNFSPCAIVKTAFGCPYQCNFCFCRMINGGKYVARDIELVIDEIQDIECDNIHIVDDTFLLDKERVIKFIALIKERNINKNFVFYSRADFVVGNEDIISQLAEINVKGIIVGLEAINDSMLLSYGKHSTNDINERCVRILEKYNIDCLALFIIDINATKEDFKTLHSWIKHVGLKYASVSIFTPIPGTDDYNNYKDRLITQDITNWDFIHLVLEPTNMTRKAFYFEYYKLFIRLLLIGKRAGIYDFVDFKYFKRVSREYFSKVLKEK